ncbi:MAG: hypothetical protein CMD46_01580 [Gammaproteobacteria bacterium]|nr:hypothetical protein [Gammaproteobacteria bacterium]
MRIIFILLIFTLNSYTDSSKDLNIFFNNELSYIQSTQDKLNNVFEVSKGTYIKNTDNSIFIEVNEPFKETYLINNNEIKIHDLEFNQVKTMPLDKMNENFLINFLINGFPENFKNQIKEKEIEFFIDFINKNTLKIKFKDNMEIENIIQFKKND